MGEELYRSYIDAQEVGVVVVPQLHFSMGD